MGLAWEQGPRWGNKVVDEGWREETRANSKMGGFLHHPLNPQSPMAPLCPLPLTRNWPDSMYLVQIQCILSRFNESAMWGLHATLLGLKGVVREPRAIAFVLWEPPCIPKLYLSSPHVPFYTHSAQGVRLCWNLSRFLARVITWEGSRPLRALIGFLLGQLSWLSRLNYAIVSGLGLESFLILIALGILLSP